MPLYNIWNVITSKMRCFYGEKTSIRPSSSRSLDNVTGVYTSLLTFTDSKEGDLCSQVRRLPTDQRQYRSNDRFAQKAVNESSVIRVRDGIGVYFVTSAADHDVY